MATVPDTTESGVAARLEAGVVVFDGAMGTMLHAAGASLDRCLPELNASRPSLVSSIHRAYLAAGADVIETNTFGANRIAMDRFGLATSAARFNRLAVSLAADVRAELGSDALIAGSIGPAVAPQASGRPLDPDGIEALVEQVAALEDAGVDLLVFETFSDLAALEAVLAVLERDPHVPIVALMTFVEDGRTIGGDTPEHIAHRLSNWNIAAIGANCTLGPHASRPIVESLVGATALPVAIQPNAGPPVIVDGRFEYRRNEEYFATTTRSFVELGARIVGGCCGTTPQHIDAVVRTIRSEASRAQPAGGATASAVLDRRDGADLAAALATRPFVVIGTVIAPDAEGADGAIAEAAALVAAGADGLVVRSTNSSRTSMSPISFGLLLQNQLGVEPVVTASTFDKSLLGLQADLLGAHAFGLRGVLCTTGTPPPRGDYPELRRVFDADALDLITALNELNGAGDGRRATKRPTGFVIGRAHENPAAADLDWEIARTKRKLEAGINFLVTDPVFDPAHFDRFVGAIGPDTVPILVGVVALRDFEHAEFLHYEAAGVTIPESVLARMREAGPDPGAVGRQIAAEIADAARPWARGVVVSPVPGAAESTRALVRSLAEPPTPSASPAIDH